MFGALGFSFSGYVCFMTEKNTSVFFVLFKGAKLSRLMKIVFFFLRLINNSVVFFPLDDALASNITTKLTT